LPFRKEVVSIANETRELLRSLERQGFTVEKTKKNHYKVFKDNRLVATLPCTPSDWRSLRNCVSVLKRAGYRP
jgi:hypothetical protein